MSVHEKLIEVRRSVPYLQKDKNGHGFKYVSSNATLGSLKAKMDNLGLLLIPRIIKHEVRDHTTKKGDHSYFTILNMTFTWVNVEEPTDFIECPWNGQGLDTGEKGLGKALTYAEKYFLLKFFNIATDQDDPDRFENKHTKAESLSENQQTKLEAAILDSGLEVSEFVKMSKVKSLSEITVDRFDGALAYLKTRGQL